MSKVIYLIKLAFVDFFNSLRQILICQIIELKQCKNINPIKKSNFDLLRGGQVMLS